MDNGRTCETTGKTCFDLVILGFVEPEPRFALVPYALIMSGPVNVYAFWYGDLKGELGLDDGFAELVEYTPLATIEALCSPRIDDSSDVDVMRRLTSGPSIVKICSVKTVSIPDTDIERMVTVLGSWKSVDLGFEKAWQSRCDENVQHLKELVADSTRTSSPEPQRTSIKKQLVTA